MRLLIAHHSLDENGGARIAAGVASYLVGRGHAVTLVGVTRTGKWHYPVAGGVDVVELTRHPQLASSLRVWVEAVPKLRKLIKRLKPHIVVGIGTLPNVVAMAANTGLRFPLVVNEQTSPRVMEGRRHSWIRNAVYRFRHPDAFIVLTQDTAALLGEWLDRSRVHVIPNPATRGPAIRPPGGTQPPVALAMGRLLPQKGFDWLLDAWSSVAGRHPDWRLVIAGDGPDRGLLEERAKRLGIDGSVDFPGFAREPFELMARSELFVLSSRYEGFPMVLVEAMASALPVVAMDCPSGPVDIVRNDADGFLVPLGDVAAMAEAMSNLMDDPSLRDTMGKSATETAERFRPDRVWAMWENVLESVSR